MPFYNLQELRLASSGRWAEVLIAAGMPAAVMDGRNHPCPKCGGRDRFAVFGDFQQRGAVHCRHCFTRGCQISPSDGIATLRWWLDLTFAETLEHLAGAVGVHPNSMSKPPVTGIVGGSDRRASDARILPAADLSQDVIAAHTRFARQSYQRMDPEQRARLARFLNVSVDALRTLRVGISADCMCSTWPMRNENAEVIGVRIAGLPWTDQCGAKWSRRGSQSGIFVPRRNADSGSPADERRGTLYVSEGASDTAAAITLGLSVIGRASCNTSTFFVDRYIHQVQPKRLVIVADQDNAGRVGARRLAKSLCESLPRSLRAVEIIVPPSRAKDLRDWVRQGASLNDVQDAVPIATITPPAQSVFDFG